MNGISAVINTRNEERNIARAIASVSPWADEVIVVDQESEDRTVEIARGLGAKVFQIERTPSVVQAREFAVGQAQREWVFVLDADELAPKALSEALRRLAEKPEADAYRIPRRNYLLGAEMKGAGWGPLQDHQLRFFRKAAATFPAKLHCDFALAEGRTCLDLEDETLAIIHFNYVGFQDFFERMNRYTEVEADQRAASGKRPNFARTTRHAIKEFQRRYYKRGGKADGWRGFYLSLMMALYVALIDAKTMERQEVGSPDNIRAVYDEVAERILSEYQ